MDDDPLSHAIRLTLSSNSGTSRSLHGLIENDNDYIQIAFEELKSSIRATISPKAQLYLSFNPELVVHPIYEEKTGVNELERRSWSRLRLSAHSLAIEEGRWNRRGRGRLPIEERLCSCGEIQTEAHVFEQCPRSLSLREHFQINSIVDLMTGSSDHSVVCECVHSILSLYH